MNLQSFKNKKLEEFDKKYISGELEIDLNDDEKHIVPLRALKNFISLALDEQAKMIEDRLDDFAADSGPTDTWLTIYNKLKDFLNNS